MSFYYKTSMSYIFFFCVRLGLKKGTTTDAKYRVTKPTHPAVFIFIHFPNLYNFSHSLFTLSLSKLTHIFPNKKEIHFV